MGSSWRAICGGRRTHGRHPDHGVCLAGIGHGGRADWRVRLHHEAGRRLRRLGAQDRERPRQGAARARPRAHPGAPRGERGEIPQALQHRAGRAHRGRRWQLPGLRGQRVGRRHVRARLRRPPRHGRPSALRDSPPHARGLAGGLRPVPVREARWREVPCGRDGRRRPARRVRDPDADGTGRELARASAGRASGGGGRAASSAEDGRARTPRGRRRPRFSGTSSPSSCRASSRCPRAPMPPCARISTSCTWPWSVAASSSSR